MKKQALFIVLVTLLALNNSQTYSSSSNQSSDGTTLLLNSTNAFSLDYSNTSSKISIFSINASYSTSGNAYLTNYIIDNSSISNSSTTVFSLSNISQNNAYILQDNYFISNNNRFIILSTAFNGGGYLNIYNIDTKKSFTLSSNSGEGFQIKLVTRLANSPDVYFCFYLSKYFEIIKYSFSTNSFSVFFQSAIFKDVYIRYTDVYKLDNKIYFSFVTRQTKPEVSDSYIYILNSKRVIYSKIFNNLEVFFFSQTDNGLFLETSLSGFFYMYYYANNSISKTNLNLTIYVLANSFIRPFSNKSLLILHGGSIEFLNVTSSAEGTTFDTLHSYDLPTWVFPVIPYALDLSSGNSYLLGYDRGNGKYVITNNNINEHPQRFVLPSVTTSSYIYLKTYPDTNAIGEALLLGLLITNLFPILLIVFIGSIFIIILQKVKKTKKSLMEIKGNNLASVNGVKKYCSNCEYPLAKGSTYCENCGKRI